MNPIDAMLKVLRDISSGGEMEARSSRTGMVLTSLRGDGPHWRVEAEMASSGHAPIGAQDPTIRRIVLPLIRAQRILGDEEDRRRFSRARESINRCEAADWRDECLAWLELLERSADT